MARLVASSRIRYPGFELEADLDLELDGVGAVFGPSGSGKTTLLRTIAGLERSARGTVRLDAEAWQDDPAGIFLPPHRRSVGFVFQDTRLFPHLSVRSNLGYGLRRTPPRERRFSLEEVSHLLDLDALLERRPLALSGGERQRVAIGRAVLTSPRLLLMDEPLASLDAGRKEEILPFIERLAGGLGIPILYVSHAIDEVSRLASTLVLLWDGRILATGPIEDVTSRLDLRPYVGMLDAGAVLRAVVRGHDAAFGLTRLGFRGGELVIPHLDLPPGTPVNALVRSRDVALSLDPPGNTSILNVLEGRVLEISEEPGPQVHVLLDVGSPLWARIMRKSIDDLGLVPGKTVYALLKAVAIDQRSLGRPTAMDRSLSRGSI